MKNEPHIPTIIGIAILLIGMLATIFLIETNPKLLSWAVSENSPQNITVANISDSQFSVGWTTVKPTISHVRYHEKGNLLNENFAYDVRDANSITAARFTHLVTISSLKPNSTYIFSLISSSKTFSVTTFPRLGAPNTATEPAFGTVLSNEKGPADILLLGNFPQAQTIASVVGNDNAWIVPLNLIRTEAGSSYYHFKSKQILALQFLDKNSTSLVKFYYDNASPLPLIRIGENYDFADLKSQLLNLLIPQALAKDVDLAFKVIFPTPNAGIPTQKPVFKGTGNPQGNVIISLNGPVVLSQKVAVSENGTWNWTPDKGLPFGKYSASFVYVPKDLKNPETIGMNFIILKSGTSVLGDATPSASLKPTPASSPKLIASPSPSLLPTPKLSPSPTSTSSTPITGNTEPTVMLLILGSLIMFVGLVIFKKRYYYKISN